ncbi:unannotated protein [freshwater metagenome]|uniref:Unannotated protein n=1 Tax=freshwater metagenome TaxID=449393 RepID=A0A6J7RGR6_9ZZZZ
MTESRPETGLVGTVIDTLTLDIECGKIAEFARATHALDPVHRDRAAAGDRGLDAIAATATHVVAAGHQRDPAAVLEVLGLDLTRVVVGSTSWEYSRPVVAGMSLTARRVVLADEMRTGGRSGAMRLITLETTFTEADGDVVVRQREVLIERGTT